jgi:hypothetical protein
MLDLRRKLGLANDTITMLTLAAMGFVAILLCWILMLTCSKKSNRLTESTMAFRV